MVLPTPTGGLGDPFLAPTMSTIVPGTYTVWATQTVLGCEGDRTSVSITVQDSLRTGFARVNKIRLQGDTVVFTSTSVGATGYSWEFGDALSSIAKNPTHVYFFPGD